MPMMFVESREEFAERHGKVCFPTLDGSGDKIFRDGARMGPHGLADPPQDADALRRAELYFWQCRVEHQTNCYQQLHADVKSAIEMAKRGMAVLPPDPEDLALLKKMAKEIAEATAERDRRERELPENRMRRSQIREHDARRSAVDPMLREFSELPTF